MKRFKGCFIAFLIFLSLASSQRAHAAWSAAELYCNVNGTVESKVNPGPTPGAGCVSGWDFSSFNTTTGLGIIKYTTNNLGANKALLFFNLDFLLDALGNNAFDETGTIAGSAAPGQHFELDDSNIGNIYPNFLSGTPDGLNQLTVPTDVAATMGWSFNLSTAQTATLSWTVATTNPGGFYLSQSDPTDAQSIFYSSSLDIRGSEVPEPMPEPNQMLPLAIVLACFGGAIRKYRRLVVR